MSIMRARRRSQAAASSSLGVDLPVAAAAQLLGLDIEGTVHLDFSSGRTDITADLKFPSLLGGATFATTMAVTDGQGLQLNSLDLNSGPTALPLGPIPAAVKNVQFHFTAPSTEKMPIMMPFAVEPTLLKIRIGSLYCFWSSLVVSKTIAGGMDGVF